MLNFSVFSKKNDMIKALQDLIKIRSVKSEPSPNMPYGKGLFDALMYVTNLAEKMDFDSVNMYSHIGYLEYGEGEEELAILTHLDVVPEGEGWTKPPFEGVVEDGKLFGRGAIDNKGPLIATLFALEAIKDNCINLKKRVKVILGCDEESGWADIDFYKKNIGKMPDMAFSPDGEFPIINSEKALLQIELTAKNKGNESKEGLDIQSLNGGTRVNIVPNLCECEILGRTTALKDLVDLFNENAPMKVEYEEREKGCLLRTKGVSAHGSQPSNGKNAIAYMILFLSTVPLKKTYISESINSLARKIKLQINGERLGIESRDESGYLTLNMGYIKTVEGTLKVGLDIRHPKTITKKDILKKISEKLPGFSTAVLFELEAHFTPEDSPLVQGLKTAYEEVTGDEAYCMSIGGATYARAFDNSVAYGPLFPGEEGTEHQADEYIKIESLIKLADIIANAIVVLCGDGKHIEK